MAKKWAGISNYSRVRRESRHRYVWLLPALRCEEILLGYFFQLKVVPAGAETDEQTDCYKTRWVSIWNSHDKCQCRYMIYIYLFIYLPYVFQPKVVSEFLRIINHYNTNVRIFIYEFYIYIYVSARNGGNLCSSCLLYFPCSSLEHFLFKSCDHPLHLIFQPWRTLSTWENLFLHFNSFNLGEHFNLGESWLLALLSDLTTMAASLWLLICLCLLSVFFKFGRCSSSCPVLHSISCSPSSSPL